MSSNNVRCLITRTITTLQTLRYISPHFTQLHFTTLIDTSNSSYLHFTTLSFGLTICISYLFPPHTTKLDTVQFSRLQTYFQNNEPFHCPKETLTISLHLTSLFILFYFFSVFLSTLHFTLLCYSYLQLTSLHFTSLRFLFLITFSSSHWFSLS
jgi:hypothetical protein